MTQQHPLPVIFLNSNQAKSGDLAGTPLPEPYVLACKLLGSGLIDRTGTLDQGFAYRVLDPIPPVPEATPRFERICAEVAAEILAIAAGQDRKVRVYWSGGIDSTAALTALLIAAEEQQALGRIEVMLSRASIREYPAFFQRNIERRLAVRVLRGSVSDSLDPEVINVTGEHGDQLYGSVLLAGLGDGEQALLDYDLMLPVMVRERFGNGAKAQAVLDYLAPQIAAAPVPLRSLFDCLWWINYSLKWQQVSLRLQAFCGERAAAVDHSVRHFFRDRRFEQWALGNPEVRFVSEWRRYKDISKQYIYEYTRDFAYYSQKCKEKSLKGVIVSPEQRQRYRTLVHMRADLLPVMELREREGPDQDCPG